MHPHFPVVHGILFAVQAVTTPEVDAALVMRFLSRIVHIACAIILGGGLFYMRNILAPAGAYACFLERRAVWARWVGAATFLLLASGLWNYIVVVRAAKAVGAPAPMSYHILFGIKFLLAMFVFFVAAILAGKSGASDRFRANIWRWLNLACTAVIAIVVIGAMLRMYH